MDILLHDERRSPRAVVENWQDLPDGVMIAQGDKACLVLSGELFAWTATGYHANHEVEAGKVHLLTPPSIVAALSAGYRVRFHSSVLALRNSIQGERRS